MPDIAQYITEIDAAEALYGATLDTFLPGLFDAERRCRFQLMALRDKASIAVQQSQSEAVGILAEVHRLAAIYAMTPMRLSQLFNLILGLEAAMDAARSLERATR